MTYEAMLSALQGLLGRRVTVILQMRFNGTLRPLAMLEGELRAGVPADLSEFEGGQTPYAPGESILFWVGSEQSCFIMRKQDFKLGHNENGDLSFMVGRVRVAVLPAPKNA